MDDRLQKRDIRHYVMAYILKEFGLGNKNRLIFGIRLLTYCGDFCFVLVFKDMSGSCVPGGLSMSIPQI